MRDMKTNKREIVSINGEIFDLKDGKISVLDHCFLYGDGVFEGIRMINRGILFHKEHIKRLYESAKFVRIPMMPKKEYEKYLFDAVKSSNFDSCYVRVVVTRGIGDLGVNPAKCSGSKLVMIVTSLKLYPEKLYENGLKLIVAKTRKTPYASLNCRIKSCNYLNNVMAKWEAVDLGADEALMVGEKGIVSEATLDNIFGVKANTLFTPGLETNCLPGITREKIMEIAKKQGMNVAEGAFTPNDFMSADEVFLTGTGAGIVPVTKIENKTIGSGKMGPNTKKLGYEYNSRIKEFCTAVD
ncbi:MAG: branched-chain-amino-acid transaminase [Nanoarchaeota archaeon]